jgi:hypothetical protein
MGWGRALLVAIAAVLGAIAAQPAAAAHLHSYAISGPPTSKMQRPGGIAVDNSNGPSVHAVYVTDPVLNRVVKFRPSGEFVLMFGDGVNETTGGDVCTAASGDVCGAGAETDAPGEPVGALEEPGSIAVDGSAGPSAGDVYVEDGNVVLKFDESGSPLTSWGSNGAMALEGFAISGLAVDPDGKLVAATLESDGGPIHSKLREFDQGGVPTGSVEVPEVQAYGMAIDSAGNRYAVGPGGKVRKIAPAGGTLAEYTSPTQAFGVTIDPSTGRLYASEAEGVIGVFGTGCATLSCAAIEAIGKGDIPAGYSARPLAVDRSTHYVYVPVSDYWGPGEVAVFAPAGGLPEASTGSVSRPSRRTAVLEATVGPAATGSVTDCRFEYVDLADLELTGWTEAAVVPCAEPLPYTAPRTVTAIITGFGAGRHYHYRVVATAAGRRTAAPRVFESGTLIEGATGPALEIAATGATLSGIVDPDPHLSAVNCHFEYLEEGRLEREGWRQALQANCAPDPPYATQGPVSARVSRLEPGKTYRYRLVAWDVWGTAVGAERLFSTPAPAAEPEAAPEFESGDRDPRRVRRESRNGPVKCSKKACSKAFVGSTRPRTWASPRFPERYGWVFSIYKNGKSLNHTAPARGCIAAFRGQGMIATLNGCGGRFRLTYIGEGRFSVRWRVFKYCRCAEAASRPTPRRAARRSR